MSHYKIYRNKYLFLQKKKNDMVLSHMFYKLIKYNS